MSFYDDASLVFLPSGGAGKDGKAYSIKPVPEYGTELVTNGGFDTDSDWNLTSGGTDANISNGKANFVNAVKGQRVQQNFDFTAAKTYKVAFTVSNYTSGLLGFYIGGVYAVSNINANGTYTYLVTPTNNSESFLRAMQTGVSHNFSVDNVSVREVVVGDADFTFSRGSNLTATRIDSNGLIEKGRENLLLQSNQFDTTWALSSTSVTSGQGGYDGSSDAWLLNSTTTGFPRIAQNVTSSGVATYSVYAKPATDGFVLMRTFGADSSVWFDLTNGTIPNAAGSQYVSSSIQSVGNGWYRCSVTFNGSLTSLRIYPASAYGVYSTSGNGVYIQDAQLEQGLVATEYIESGASTGLAGILEDSPRFDYSGGASCPSLLLEPSRTNSFNYSEYFGGLTKLNATLETNNTTSPEGLQNASRFLSAENDTLSKYIDFQGSAPPSTENQVFSLFVKNYNHRYIQLINNGDADLYANFDIANGIIGNYGSGTTASIEDYGNGWYRCTIVCDGSQNNINSACRIYLVDSLTQGYANQTNVALGNGVYIWGAMQENNASYPTSYIPNHSSGSVTREADVSTLLNQSGVIGQTAGTILFDAYFDEADKVNFSISDSTSSNYILIDTTSGKQVFARVQQGGSTQATISTSGSFFAEGDRLKCAIAYDDRDMAFYINGTQVGTAAPNLLPACDDVRFSRWNGALAADQRVNRVVLFDTRISNGILATLTS